MGRKLRRYKFSGIERLTREQVRLRNALLKFLPQTPFERGFKDQVREAIEPLVHADIDLWFDTVTDVGAGELSRALGNPLCAAVIGLSPKTEKILIEVDLGIAQQAVERTLGGATEDVDISRPLSEIEEGVFAFLLLKVLRLAQAEFGQEQQVGLKLEGLCGDHEGLGTRVDVEQPWVALSFKLFFDVAVGYVRVFLPRVLAEREFMVPVPDEGPALSRYLTALGRRAGRVAALKTELVVEVGRIGLALDDLEALEEEDIILVENPDIRMADGELSGRAACRVGLGRAGLIYGSLLVGETGQYEVAIEEILNLGEPDAQAHLAPEGEQFVEDEQQQEMSRRLSAPLADVTGDLLRAAAARAASGRAAPLPTAVDDVRELGAEHSEGEEGEVYEEEGEEEPLPESAGLLDDVSVPMVVELGRVEVSAADIVGLRPGQVIELSRAPGDAVDLVVDNRRIGKGELVEIEGELGVRILSLAK
jgi:type III secretion system YscQ/HrcQ family protein